MGENFRGNIFRRHSKQVWVLCSGALSHREATQRSDALHYTLMVVNRTSSNPPATEQAIISALPINCLTSWGATRPAGQVGAVVVGIVHDSNGRVDAQDASGEGTEGEDNIPGVPEHFFLETIVLR
jgi:hypothetical protein